MSPNNPLFDVNPPASIESEKALLGAIMINPDAFLTLSDQLAAADFFYLRHQHIWSAMHRLHTRREPIDIELLAEELENVKQLEAIGGRAYLAEVTNSVPTSRNAEFYAGIVERTAVRRRLLKATDDIKALATDEALDVEAVCAQSESLISNVSSRRAMLSEASSMRDIIDEQYAAVEEYIEDGAFLPDLLPSSFIDAQYTLEGYADGSLNTFGARPGVGKSSLIVAEAVGISAKLRAAQDDRRNVIYSLEMTKRQVADSVAALVTRIPHRAIRKRQLSAEQARLYLDAVKDMIRLQIDVHDRLRYLEDIVADIRRRHHQFGVAVAFVDYVQLVKTRLPFKGDGAKRLQLGHITGTLKELAMDLNIRIVMGAQLRRNANDEPTMELLKEAGNIEEDSDTVTLIHRDMKEAKSLRPGEVQPTTMIVDKNRHGATGRFQLGFLAECKAFVPMADAGFDNAPAAARHWSDR